MRKNELYGVEIVEIIEGNPYCRKAEISANNLSNLIEYLPKKLDSYVAEIKDLGKTEEQNGLIKFTLE